ncbi:MAG: glycine--tRNA ligase [Candidatus Jordarchaeales archaeon]
MERAEKSSEGKSLFEKVWTLALHRGFVIPTAEIYGGIAGIYDFGPLGTLLVKRLIDLWRRFFIIEETNFPVYEVSGATILPYEVLVASGHVDSFVDPLVACLKCKAKMRADHLVEEKLGVRVEGATVDELNRMIRENGLRCPNCGGELSEVTLFNLMFKTEIGPLGGKAAFLRPETAQVIFIDFKKAFQAMRGKLPFGLAQVGKAYRNEISPRQGLIRLREFTQMEIEVFINPKEVNNHPGIEGVADSKFRVLTREGQLKGEEAVEVTVKESVEKGVVPIAYMAYYLSKETEFFERIGIPRDKFYFRHMMPEETPFYSGGNFDLEVELSIGVKEVVGNAYRTDHDLRSHMRHSGEDLSVDVDGEKVVPEVVEPSFGVERIVYCILEYCYREDDGRGWSWFQFPPEIAPVTALILPLMKKEPLVSKAKEMFRAARKSGVFVEYDDRGSIGKRYARADEIGVPVCVTIDYQTIDDGTVTLRNRDTRNQVRVKAELVPRILLDLSEGRLSLNALEALKS